MKSFFVLKEALQRLGPTCLKETVTPEEANDFTQLIEVNSVDDYIKRHVEFSSAVAEFSLQFLKLAKKDPEMFLAFAKELVES